MGGVWFDALNPLASPIVWRQRFPVRVARQLVTSNNRHGAITISDLELTGMIAHKDILAQLRDVAERTVWIASDNRAAVAWSAKGSATSMAARAYLLRHNALHQRQHRYISRHRYIPGPVNVMADDASELLVHADPATRDQCRTDWRVIQETTAQRVSTQRAASGATAWALWEAFCASLRLDPLAIGNRDPIPLLQLYAQRYRDGTIAAGRHPVRARTVDDAVRAVGQTYAGMGAPDPRLDRHGQLDLRLAALYRAWKRMDDPPTRVKPLSLAVVAHVWATAHRDATPRALATAECLVIGFYFLLRPGEYLGTPRGTQFLLRNVKFWIGSRALSPSACREDELLATTFAALTFNVKRTASAMKPSGMAGRATSPLPGPFRHRPCHRPAPCFCGLGSTRNLKTDKN
ncbi:hypothetical protein MHU86_12164 [Fragilaria crotonensis]|nr:hypothetical protein MHU86_12164 [Fragilaria crotonensis]